MNMLLPSNNYIYFLIILSLASKTMQYITNTRISKTLLNHRMSPIHPNPQQRTFTTKLPSSQTNTTIEKPYSKKLKRSQEPLYIREGLFSVIKPSHWTSSNVVEYIRRIFEMDARKRGVVQGKNRKLLKVGRVPPVLKVGHGGTLDPLATGVLVIGIGGGTKRLKHYLSGTKRYVIRVKLGIETTTLDMEGNITKIVPYSHITQDMVEYVLPSFVGDIEQVPPLYSALKQNGTKLYELARDDHTNTDEIIIPSRNVTINSIKLTSFEKGNEDVNQLNILGQPHTLNPQSSKPTIFELDVECGGGTYMRSLARDIALKLGTAATCTSIQRVKQGPFTLEDSLDKDEGEWNMIDFIKAMDVCRERFDLN